MDFKYSLNGISIRKTTEADLDFILSAERHEENAPYVAQWSAERHREAFADEDIMHIIIEEDAICKPVGYAIIAGLKDCNRSIEIRRVVVADKGKGLGRRFFELYKKLAFEELKAHRLWLDVREFNDRAIHLYKSLGFVQEGLIRECILLDGRFFSIYIMSILEQEYKKQ